VAEPDGKRASAEAISSDGTPLQLIEFVAGILLLRQRIFQWLGGIKLLPWRRGLSFARAS